MDKYEQVRTALERDPKMSDCYFKVSPLATLDDLELAHSSDYVCRFLDGRLTAKESREVGFPWSVAGSQRALASTGGTVAAAVEVVRSPHLRMTGQIAGGTHHARRERGAGFCVFNDLAVAACVVMRDFPAVQTVLILDFDVHQGEGTAAIFQDDPRVITFSMHAANNYPFQKERSTYDIALPDGTGDEEYLRLVRSYVPGILERHRPQLVLLQMGVDSLEADGLGRLSLSRSGLSTRNRDVYDAVLRAGIPAVVTMGGGYSRPNILDSIHAHEDVYRDAMLALTRFNEWNELQLEN